MRSQFLRSLLSKGYRDNFQWGKVVLLQIPVLKPGQVVVMDNATFHKVGRCEPTSGLRFPSFGAGLATLVLLVAWERSP
jgi:hypothetical protein